MAIDPMEFMEYDKISDEVLSLGLNVVLKFNVSLSKTSGERKRFHFYKEYEYPSRCDDIENYITIKRSFDYYMSLENVTKPKTGKGEKAFIRIGPSEYMRFKQALEVVMSWFTDKKFKGLFVKNNGKLIMTSGAPELLFDRLPQGKYIHFIPTVIDYGRGNDMMEPGVTISLADLDNNVSISVDRLMGLYYVVSSYNMFQSAQIMVGYLGCPGGVNRFTISPSYGNHDIKVEEFDGNVEGVSGRTVGKKKNISSLE